MERLSKYIGLPTGCITLTNGADQAIDITIKSLFEAGDRVIIPSPTFSYYYHVLKLNSVAYDPVLYTNAGNGFEFPYYEVMAKLSEADGVILTNPSNPLGISIPDIQLEGIINKCEQYNIPCIIDEAYFEYSDSSVCERLKNCECLIIIRTFSKYFGLAGVRIGYVISDPIIGDIFQSVRGPWDVNCLAVLMGTWCIDNAEFFKTRHLKFIHNKNTIERSLRSSGIFVSQTKANFILARDNTKPIPIKFAENNVMVSDLAEYPESRGLLVNHTRIGIPANENDVSNFISIIQSMSPVIA